MRENGIEFLKKMKLTAELKVKTVALNSHAQGMIITSFLTTDAYNMNIFRIKDVFFSSVNFQIKDVINSSNLISRKMMIVDMKSQRIYTEFV